jgi:hypothetical protein
MRRRNRKGTTQMSDLREQKPILPCTLPVNDPSLEPEGFGTHLGYAGSAYSLSRAKNFLLCRECDNSLNKNGENWIIPRLARQDGDFPLVDLLERLPADVDQEQFKVYGVAKNPCIDVRKLSHFAMGVFWKASRNTFVCNMRNTRLWCC